MQDNRFTRRFRESNFEQDLRIEGQAYSLWDLMKKRVKLGKLFRQRTSAHVRIIERPLHGRQARILSNHQRNNLEQENADGKHNGSGLFGQFARGFNTAIIRSLPSVSRLGLSRPLVADAYSGLNLASSGQHL